MKLVNISNQGVIEVADELGKKLVSDGSYTEFEEPQANTTRRHRRRKTDEVSE